METKQKEGLHPLALMVAMAILAMILSYVVPAGAFERAVDPITGRMSVVAGSFQYAEQSPVGIWAFLQSFHQGIVAASTIGGFLLLIGGGFGIVNGTGAIEALMAKVIIQFKSEKGQEFLIFVLLTFFALCGAVFGMSMEALVFAPFLMGLLLALGYDALLGMAIPVIGVNIGYGAAFINPFNLGIAQEIAEIPYLSGMGYRVVFFVLCLFVATAFLIFYGRKIKKSPETSLTFGIRYNLNAIKDPTMVEMTKRHKAVLLVFVLSIIGLVYGAMFKSFYMTQCATVFLIMGVVSGIVYGMNVNEIASAFVDGAKDMVLAVLLVSFANVIVVVLEAGMIMDTIIYYATLPLQTLSPAISAGLMVVVQTLINVMVNSGSGQAVVAMPLMVPIADLAGVNRQVAVLAYQIGDGFSNMLWFTSGLLMSALGILKISYFTWLKFIGKIFGSLFVLGVCATILAQVINLV